MAHTIEEIKKIRNGRGTSAASSSDSTKTRSTGHSIEEIRRLGGRSVYTDSEGYTPTKASAPIAQTRPEFRYNSIEEYDKALKEKKQDKASWLKKADNGMINAVSSVIPGYSTWAEKNREKLGLPSAKYTEAENEYKELEAERNRYLSEHIFDEYQKKYMGNDDFSTYSAEPIKSVQMPNDARQLYGYTSKMTTDDVYYWDKLYNRMTEDEKAVYRYLQNSGRDKEAFQYLSDMDVYVGKRDYDKKVEDTEKWADESSGIEKFGKDALLTAKRTWDSTEGSLGTGMEYVNSLISGTRANPYKGSSGQANYAQDVTNIVAQDIADATGSEKVAPFLYKTVMSTADSAIEALMFGEAAAVIMGTNAFNSSYKELSERGASDKDIVLGSLLSGAAETIFEYVSLDKLLEPKAITTWYELVAETLKQAGVEASEETFTELANIFSDEFVNGPNSEVSLRVKELKAQGKSDDEIKKIIEKELRSRIIEAAAGGALSGGMMSGMFNGSQLRQNKEIGSSIDRQEFRDNLDTETKYDLENQYGDNWTNEVSDARMGAIYKDVVNKAYSEDVFKIDKNLNVSDTTTLNGEEAKLTGFTKIGDRVVLNTDKGRADLKDIKLSKNDAQIITIAEGIKDDRFANAFVKNYGGEDVADYDMYARYLYEAGKVNADWTENVDLTDKVISTLGKDKANAIYEAGQMSDVQDLKFLKTAYDVAVSEMKSQNIRKGDFAGGSFDADGNFVKDDDFYRNLSRTKKRIYLLCKAFADFAGVNVQVINDDNVASENGHFVVDRPDGGTVMINLAARPYGDSAYGMHSYVLDTLSHELTHWMRGNNEEGYTILEKAISEHLKSKGVYDDLIKNEIESHKKAHPGEKFSEADALEEVVARGCEDMLDDPKTMREVLSTLDVNSLEKLRIAFDKWFERIEAFIEKLMSGFESPNETIKYLRDEYNTFRKLWVEGIQDAIKNAQTEVTEEEQTEKFSLKRGFIENMSIEDKINYAKFDKEIKSYKSGKHPTRNHLKVMDHVPNLLLQLGLGQKEVYMTKVHFNDITHKEVPNNSHYHGLTVEEVRQAPVLINHPAIIVDSMTDSASIVIISPSLDYKKRPIIIALKTDGKAYSIDWRDSNFLTSMYGRNDFVNWINRHIKANKVLYLSKENSQMLEGLGLRLPASLKALGYDKIIHQSQNAVKTMKYPKQMNSDKLSSDQKIADERQQNSLNKVLNKVGVEVEDSYAYPKYSLKTWRSSEYSQDAETAAKALAKSMEISVEEAKQYIEDIGSIASQIANDPDRLDYASIEGKSAWVSNPEYGGSLDYSFLCPKRLTYTGTMNAILAKQNDLIFSVDDFLYLRRALIAAGYEAPCSFCFVESARARFGKYNAQFIDIAKEEKLAYIPTAEELSNPDKLEEMRSEHPETFKRYEKFLNSLSQRKPKMLEERRPYNGDILKAFQDKEHTIIEKNLHGGIRFNSFSDFEIVHMIDCMQAIMDMSRVGLAGFGYTKQKAFAQIFGKTGLKIDMSCVAKGVTQDGKHIIFDDVEGMNHKDALKLRNGNVGIVCVVFTDDQVRAALCDERIDYVLPFHRSQWSKKDYEKMGLSLDTKDYTRLQTEKLGTKKAKEGNIPFLSYWNENQTGEETVQRYLDIINEQNKTPIFPFILEKDEKGNWIMPKGKRDHNGKLLNKKEEIKELAAKNYWKLLTEYKMYENDGTPIGQYPVKPIFDMDAANELLTKYDGSHKEFPVSEKVVEDFMYYKKTGESKLLPEWKRNSDKLDNYGRELSKSVQKFFAESDMRTDDGRLMTMFHGSSRLTYTEFDAKYSDDKLTFWFSSDPKTSETYSGSERIINPYDMTAISEEEEVENNLEIMNSIAISKDDHYYLREEKSGYSIVKGRDIDSEDLKVVGRGKTQMEAFEDMLSNNDIYDEDFFEKENYAGIYEVYLNIKNPLVIDAHGQYWNNIPREVKNEVTLPISQLLHYNFIIDMGFDPDEFYDYLPDTFRDDPNLESVESWIDDLEDTDLGEKDFDNIRNDYKILQKAYKKWKGTDEEFIDYVKESATFVTNTRQLAQEAKKNGHDGLIVKNVIDNGPEAYFDGESTIAAVFDSDQVKSVYNTNPTHDADIRRSDKLDSEGNRLTEDQAEFFKDSKIVDKDGNLKVEYHGTNSDFFIFDTNKFGGVNGKAEGYGIYFTDDQEITNAYGGRQLKGYVNITKPAYSTKKTIKSSDLVKLIKTLCENEAKQLVESGDYDSVADAIKDTWVSNYEYTYDKSMNEVYKLVADSILKLNSSDMDIIQEVMNGTSIYSYEEANEFYSVLKDTLGFDGFVTYWTPADGNKKSEIVVAFDSNQFKLADNMSPTKSEDIRYSDKLNSAYMDAVDNKRMAEADILVEQAAKEAEYNYKAFHGTFADFTEFDLDKANEDSFLGRGFYFTSNENEAKNTYASFEGGDVQDKIDREAAVLLDQWGYGWDASQEFPDEYNHKLMKYTNDASYWKKVSDKESDRLYNKAVKEVKESLTGKGKVMPVYLKLENPYIVAENDTRNPYEIIEEVNKGNHDGIIDYSMAKRKNLEKGTIHYVVLKPNQVKSAETVVYDENNNIIPLSERFNANNNDTRYSEKLDLTDATPEVRERVRELEKQVGKLTKENDALKAAKAMAAEKAQKEALMSKIIEQSKTLGKWLLTDPKANPVPQALRKPIINLLRSIDYTTSSYAWRKAHEQQYTKKDQSMAVMMGRINHMLHEIDQDMVNDPEAYDMSQLDWLPAFNKEFEQITNAISEAEKASGEKFNLQQMSVEDLDTLNKLIGALKTSVHNMNKVFGEHNKETVSDLGNAMISYLENIGLKDVDNALTQFMEIDNTTPYYFFKRLGPSGQKLFRILMDAQGEYAFKAQEIEEYAKDVFKGKDVIKWREIVKEFDITEVRYGKDNIAITEEKHIKMTVPQIMSLYCLAKRDQALRHISSGGIKIATFKDGKNEVRQLDNVTLSESDLKMIVGTLTDEQKEVADKLQEFLSTTCSKWGNEVTMQRFGYKAYTEKNYFPINVDQNVLTKEARQRGSSLYQLLNMGFTKPLNPKARNPIEIFDIFETFTIHSTDMAQYNAFALPILNVIRVWNYKEVENLDTEQSDWTSTKENVERDTGEEAEVVRQKYITVKGSIEKAIGKKGNHYIGTLLADLNGDVTHGRADGLDKFSKNYKTAAVAANMQVVMLQPLSYIRAGYAIDNKYLAKAVAMRSNPELIKKYCGIAVWKSMGFYNLAINNGLAHKIMQDDSTKDKLIDKTLWLAGKMDEYTWRKLWNACELEIRDTTKLEVGSEKYYQAVGERLTDLIFGTQVVDSVLTKSELMRGQDTYTKMLTAFNAEPTLGLNIVMDAAEMFDQDRRANGTQHALRTQGANMRKAASVYLAGSLAESILRAVWGRIRNYDGDEDDETLLHEILTRFLQELNPLRKIPFVKDLYGILFQTIAVFRKDQYKVYADTRMDEASIEALANAIGQIPKVIEKQEITYKDINKIAKGIDATGLPVSNTMRIFKGIWNNTIGRIWESALIK